MQGSSSIRIAEMKLRVLEDHIKEQTKSKHAAQWSRDLKQKDCLATKMRSLDILKQDKYDANMIGSDTRREKITALYREEAVLFESELEAIGLAFRHERL
jgi:hypothetical protein